VVAACVDVEAALGPGPEQALVARIREGLAQPLRVAVAGRVNAGKSTLVNALLGQRVAPTDVSECTRYVTWYRHGLPERCEVVGRDGTRATLALLADGSLPRSPGETVTDVSRLEVYLTNDTLRELVLIDTPGLGSLNADFSAGTMELLGLDGDSRRAVSEADALIFVLTASVREQETGILEAFRDVLVGTSASPLSTVCVLNKADLAGDSDGDPLDAASALAIRYADGLHDAVAGVYPIVSLLAETVDTGRFNESHALALRSLAALPPPGWPALVVSADRFRTIDAPVTPATRGELLALLGLYGVTVALQQASGGASSGAQLLAELRARSGVESLRSVVLRSFGGDADALKANAALLALERLAYDLVDPRHAAARDALHDAIDEVRIDPSMHRLLELRALQELTGGIIDLPDDLDAELRRLVTADDPPARLGLPVGASPDDVQRAATAAMSTWRRFRNDGRASPMQQWVADVMNRTCEQLWLAASASSRGGSG
jgi:hypothetical protein